MSDLKRVEIRRSINRRIEQIRKLKKAQASLSGTADSFAQQAARKLTRYQVKKDVERGYVCDRCDQPLRAGNAFYKMLGRFGVSPHDQFSCPGPQAAAQTGK